MKEKIESIELGYKEKRYILGEVKFCIEQTPYISSEEELDWYIWETYNKLKRIVDSQKS